VVYRTVQDFFKKADDTQDTKDVTISANCYEIHLDKIRDLCVGIPNSEYTTTKIPEAESENMEIMDYIAAEDKQEDLKKYGMVKGGTVVVIKSIADIERMLKYSIKTREKLSLKYGSGSGDGKAHMIFNINIRVKERHNPSSPGYNSIIQFVRFGGTEKMSKAVNHPYKGEKYQESILINSDNANLAKVIYAIYTGQKSINYDESKLVKVMRLTLNNKSSVGIVACVNPNEANFEDSLNTLAHLDRCKNFEEASKDKGVVKKAKEVDLKPKTVKPGKLNAMQELQEQIQDKKNKIEYLQAEYKKKFDDLARELNLHEDIEKLIYNPNAKEWKHLREQRMAFEKWASMELFERQLDQELDELKTQEEKLRVELRDKENDYQAEKKEIQKVISELRTELGNVNKDVGEHKQKIGEKIGEEIKGGAKISKSLLESKIEPPLALPQLIHKRTEMNKVRKEATKTGLKEAHDAFTTEFNNIQKEHDQKLEYLKQQFDELCIRKRDDIERSALQFDRYLAVKK
jgi:hypothetical protein